MDEIHRMGNVYPQEQLVIPLDGEWRAALYLQYHVRNSPN